MDARELAVLAVLAAGRPLSQLQAARRLGVDRTTMVALVDALEGKGLVERHRSALPGQPDAARRVRTAGKRLPPQRTPLGRRSSPGTRPGQVMPRLPGTAPGRTP
ncbi:MarR family transcriptional regulator [Streptomyces sp. NPDC051133]|uniref:MarR family transcriptional regulator n=1 Tax=Streptomyces sp. NPDC051133 TaxID=3155521 RepID=UPI00342408C3